MKSIILTMNRYLLLLFMCLPFAVHAQTNTRSEMKNNYEKQWHKADSLMSRSLPQSAEKIIKTIYEDALKNGNQVQVLKSEIYFLKINTQTKENSEQENILTAEEEIKKTSFPNKAVWQSLCAELYWNYYTNNRWQILNRTTVANQTSDDFEAWDANHFYKKVTDLYLASIADKEALKKIKINEFNAVLQKGNTDKLRPTLYDLLVFRAIDHFTNEEKELTQPAYQFQIKEAQAFAAASEFAAYRFESKDSMSLQLQALKLYQQIIAFHLQDASPDALIDADIQRLNFVYRKSIAPNKKQLYLDALHHISSKYASSPASAEASYLYYTTQYDAPQTDYSYRRKIVGPSVKKPDVNYPLLKEKLEEIVKHFPESEGGIHAQNRITQLEIPLLNVQAEENILPNEASKVLVTYTNTPNAYFRVYSVTMKEYNNGRNFYDTGFINKLLRKKPLQSWSEKLPGTEDYEQHSAEVKVDALPEGHYWILTSTDEKFATEKNLLVATKLQVTHIAFIDLASNNDVPKGYMLDRQSGQPLTNAKVDLMAVTGNEDRYTVLRNTTTAADGSFNLDKDERFAGIAVHHDGQDAFFSWYYYNYANNRTPKETRTIFFTDRSIYRPGQTVYFKAIRFNSDSNRRKNTVVPNQSIQITFFDVNGQEIASQTLTTNEFGSVQGSFKAPESGLTGQMRLSDGVGDAYVSVEEYKRPKFFVQFDTLKSNYALNETIHLKGKAQAYAGSNIDGATVKYRVIRNTIFPYSWRSFYWGYPSSSTKEMGNGTATTDANGNFTVDFQAAPDETVNKETDPVFTYNVYADVTDINGETHSGTQSVSVGYHSFKITADIPTHSAAERLDSLQITTENLNNQFIPREINVRVSLLKSPPVVYRKRIWDTPDQFVMDEATFHKYLPLDEYKNESDPTQWPVAAQVFNQAFTTIVNGKIAVPAKTWTQTGYYEILITAKDKNGDTITEKKYVLVWNKASQNAIPASDIVIDENKNYEPGNTASVYLLSGLGKTNWMQIEKSADEKTIFSNHAAGSDLTWTKNITDKDIGTTELDWITVKDNRFYHATASINVPAQNNLDISWETHRDKLMPGQKESWTMIVRGPKKEKLAAEMVATLYDASLDALNMHDWSGTANMLREIYTSYLQSNAVGFGPIGGVSLASRQSLAYLSFVKVYDQLLNSNSYERYYAMEDRVMASSAPSPGKLNIAGGRASGKLYEVSNMAPPFPNLRKEESANDEQHQNDSSEGITSTANRETAPPIRKNLQETAFFYPQLKTDAEGNIRIQFTIPEALTEWKLMAFAHTKDLKFGQLQGKVKTQKDLMVVPGLPRFFRQGDDITITAKINNLSDHDLKGTAKLEIVDAQTEKDQNLPFRIENASTTFEVVKGQSTVATWKIHIPESRYEPVLARISAQAGNFTDGEENMMPVITNRMLVTETLPFWMNGNGTKEYHFDKLLHSDSSKTLAQHRLTLEYTGNPAWYAVQSLPYLMEYPYECAEQTFNRYYANSLAAHILKNAPKVKAIFDKWQTTDTTALLSNLEKNQELKSALLEETPWVMAAQNETEQKHRIAMLFETNKLSNSLTKAMNKLNDMVLPEGGFPWFKGGESDRYITQYITTGLGRLHHLGVIEEGNAQNNLLNKTLPYLDRKLKEDYDQLVKSKADLTAQNISYFEIQYLYMRSFFIGRDADAGVTKAIDYYRGQAAKYWPSFNAYMKGMIALDAFRNGDKKTANEILQSLRETAQHKEEMGMYWTKNGGSYWWYDAPVETQSLMIECFKEVANDTKSVDEMKRWLLKQKQTQNWATTKSTADACYALLLQGTQWLNEEPQVTIKVGDKTIRNTDQKAEAGTGYFKTNFTGKDIKPEMGNISLNVASSNSSAPSWGAVYWQYFENLDKITAAATPLSIKKQLFVEHNGDRGPELVAITENSPLQVGDKVKIRIELSVDRDMEYVHLKDMRGACFEPQNVLSGYRWQGGLGYYESTKDVSSNFFFSYLPKGKYVFEYPVFVTNKGSFSNGIATIQCMYAPEFSAHSEGIRVMVK
ncbi:alpha-2-macroglobulin family protein [Taibaiella soli]|uniref:Alpha-2-macroglobulin n=1 Tax=Taibaiella soli TaxID=1649169 RepID=A0A2W2BY99_9BACT|nr:alpha-2-macroglobulin family protein [Taibaiella soli]PZF72833.1 alpha-2-macroglobulin [Taibaiella soli]